jgi:Co/Zn/Cd efflux system component
MSTECDEGDACRQIDTSSARKRQTLRSVLLINLGQSLGGVVVGIWAASTALIGAGLDNLSDAAVYAIALYAVGRTAIAKARVASLSGWLLLILAALLLVEVVRRFFYGAEPIGVAMIVAASINAGLNQVCLRLLAQHRGEDVTFKATAIFTNNDTWANLGIVVSGVLVWMFASPLPDLMIGIVVVVIAIKGGREILQEALEARGKANQPETGCD